MYLFIFADKKPLRIDSCLFYYMYLRSILSLWFHEASNLLLTVKSITNDTVLLRIHLLIHKICSRSQNLSCFWTPPISMFLYLFYSRASIFPLIYNWRVILLSLFFFGARHIILIAFDVSWVAGVFTVLKHQIFQHCQINQNKVRIIVSNSLSSWIQYIMSRFNLRIQGWLEPNLPSLSICNHSMSIFFSSSALHSINWIRDNAKTVHAPVLQRLGNLATNAVATWEGINSSCWMEI